jgi:hypothetical protein
MNGYANLPDTYYRLAADRGGKLGHKPISPHGGWGNLNASRYVREFQSRRSLLVWKIYGRRTDGWTNDDFPTETVLGDVSTLALQGERVEPTHANRVNADVDYMGSIMPPPAAVAGDYDGADGKKIKVAPLSDEDRRTIVRWIDLGCPIDLAYDPAKPTDVGAGGWMHDDQRPTLALASPQAGVNESLANVLVGMHDYGAGLDGDSFSVKADFEIDGIAAGENLASRFKPAGEGIWEFKFANPIATIEHGTLEVSIRDRQGNNSQIKRTFSIAGPGHTNLHFGL